MVLLFCQRLVWQWRGGTYLPLPLKLTATCTVTVIWKYWALDQRNAALKSIHYGKRSRKTCFLQTWWWAVYSAFLSWCFWGYECTPVFLPPQSPLILLRARASSWWPFCPLVLTLMMWCLTCDWHRKVFCLCCVRWRAPWADTLNRAAHLLGPRYGSS